MLCFFDFNVILNWIEGLYINKTVDHQVHNIIFTYLVLFDNNIPSFYQSTMINQY